MVLKASQIIVVLSFMIVSCGNKKEAELQVRENQLLLREQQLLVKEDDYQKLLTMRDSLEAAKGIAADTIGSAKQWPDSLPKAWSSKMICRESDCSNYIIGDQRNEIWQFASDSTGLIMKVINKEKLVRVFKGSYATNKIELDFSPDSTAKSAIKIKIRLDDVQKNVIKGTQVITGQKNCTATFSVELTPSTKK